MAIVAEPPKKLGDPMQLRDGSWRGKRCQTPTPWRCTAVNETQRCDAWSCDGRLWLWLWLALLPKLLVMFMLFNSLND